MQPSPQQKDVYSAFTDTKYNLNISAVAGSGKTTTLLGIFDLIPDDAQALFMAFNNAIVGELKARTTPRENVRISTLHSYGLYQIKRRYGNVRINEKKALGKTELALRKFYIPEKQRGYYFYMVPKVLDLMRCNLIDPTEQELIQLSMHYDIQIDDSHIPVILYAFKKLCEDKTQVDFMDMIYVPVVDPTIRCMKYDYLLVDESQDMSVCQHQLIKKSLKRTGRLITVGDPNQAIYGFAGADAESYNKLSEINGDSVALPLSVSYRCPKSVVKEAQRIVPQISYHPNSPDGEVRAGSLTELKDGDWVVCRNLKPLVETYLWLLKNHVKSKIRGKDIGEGIVALINKTGARTISGLITALSLEKDKLHSKLTAKGIKRPSLHPKMELMEQRLEVIECLSAEVDNVAELKQLINTIFTDELQGILLTTIHKSKGLENDRIFFLLPELIPSQYAVMDWQLQQERNLKYVAITRSKDTLIYVYTPVYKEDLKTKLM